MAGRYLVIVLLAIIALIMFTAEATGQRRCRPRPRNNGNTGGSSSSGGRSSSTPSGRNSGRSQSPGKRSSGGNSESSSPSSSSSSSSSSSKPGSKEQETLAEVFKSEGLCQNWSSDRGNSFQGRLIPGECWNNKNGAFSWASGFSGHPSMFCKYAFDKDRNKYKQSAAQIYSNKYFKPGGCQSLPQPAFYVCADIAINSGTGRSKQYLRELGPLNGNSAEAIKAYARKLNERHRKDYIKWSSSGSQAKFRQGWLNRAKHRDQYINNYRI